MSCIQFRPNPANPACVQVSCDNGETWSDAFCGVDATLGATKNYDDLGHAIISTDGGVSFSNADLYDERFNSPAPQGHIGDNPACRSAENVAEICENFKETITTAITIGGGIAAILGVIVDFIGVVFGFAVPPSLVIVLVGAITALTVAEWEAVMNEDRFNEFKCIVFCALGGDTAPTPIRFDGLVYDTMITQIRAQMSGVPRFFFEAWTMLTGPIGLQVASVQASNDGLSCDLCDCPVCPTDFDYNWYDNIAVDITDWTVADKTIWPNSLIGTPTLSGGYAFTFASIDAHGYVTAPGYQITLDGNILGAYADIDPDGCIIARVFISAYTINEAHSAGFHVLIYKSGVWEDAGQNTEWTGNWTYHEGHIDVDMTDVTKVGIVGIARGGVRVGRVRIVFL
jgi:hypothetical protein